MSTLCLRFPFPIISALFVRSFSGLIMAVAVKNEVVKDMTTNPIMDTRAIELVLC